VARRIRIAAVGEIPVGRAKAVVLEGLELAVFNAGEGGFHACAGTCPHEGGPLADGGLHGGLIVCPWHGYDFDPQSGECQVDPELSVAVYPVHVEDGDVLVEIP
jgi:nitrite reductase (NADH) small subunit